jgi:putative nucleotidyltransferase with HDIG domain
MSSSEWDRRITARSGYMTTDRGRARIPVEALKVGMHVIELDRPWEETPFIFQGFEITSVEQIAEVAQYAREVVVEFRKERYVPRVERDLPAKGKRKSAPAPSRPVSARRSVAYLNSLQTEAKSLTRSMMDDIRLGRAVDVKSVKSTVSACVKSILQDPDAMMWLSRIRDRDQYTSEHCVNVGLLAIHFGRHRGLGEEDLNKLGVAGMLHDVGKMRTPEEVLNKEGALTQQEFEIMRAHTVEGRDILMSSTGVYHGTVDVAYTHHESLDGTGYPRKIKASGISDSTRMITLCDVYDAVTSDRCYKKGQSSLRALQLVQGQAGRKFDPKLAEEFIKCIGLYPPGSLVELSGGSVGIVLSTNHRNRRLPRVLQVLDGNKQACEERVLDLQKLVDRGEESGYLIRDVVPNGAHGLRVEDFIRRGLELK